MTDRNDPGARAPGAGDGANDYALDRTVLANERTYTAWIRTGLTALAAGVAIEKFMVDVIPPWGVRAIAVILIGFSAVAFFVAAWRYTHLGIKLGRADVKRVPLVVTIGTSLILIACALIALAGLWMVTPPPGP
jgi:putative membrane protein